MRSWSRRRDRAALTVEFAIVSALLCTAIFGVLEISLLCWLKSGIQSAAAMTARCGAVGYKYSTSSCVSSATTQSYAVAAAQSWLFASVIAASDVTVGGQVASCNGLAGNFFQVSINGSYFATLPPPLSSISVSASACYPMS